MRKLVMVLLFSITFIGCAQKGDYNIKNGYVANGYDVVAYFQDEAIEGDKTFTVTYGGVDYKFANQVNLETFKENPNKYIPKYGGYCAYAVAVKGNKVSINPETFEIRDGELYLFYNSGRTNTLELWKNESPDDLRAKADENWQKLINR